MAPVYVAGCLLLLVVWMFVVFLLTVLNTADSLLVYDRQTLLDLRLSAKDLVKFGGHKTLLPLLSGIPAYLCRLPAPYPRRKRHRRRGKRSGRMVRVKACLAHFSMASWTEHRAVPRLIISWRLLDPVDAWLVPVVGPDEVFQPRAPCSPRPRWRGVNLRPLCRIPRKVSTADFSCQDWPGKC